MPTLLAWLIVIISVVLGSLGVLVLFGIEGKHQSFTHLLRTGLKNLVLIIGILGILWIVFNTLYHLGELIVQAFSIVFN